MADEVSLILLMHPFKHAAMNGSRVSAIVVWAKRSLCEIYQDTRAALITDSIVRIGFIIPAAKGHPCHYY